MRFFLLAAVAGSLVAQVPASDVRNRAVPSTDTHFTMPKYDSLSEWTARTAYLRRQILSAAGLYPLPEKTPLRPQVFGRIENGDYSIEKVLLEPMPGFFLGGNLYRPTRNGKFPAVLSPHGHWRHGRLENTPACSVPARCINLARQGYVVFAYDMVGYNDTRQIGHSFGGKSEQLWNFGPLGIQLWDSIRAADFLLSLPYVDDDRLACTGASGGGTQTFLLTAIDDRVRYAAPVNMVSAIMQGGDTCENAPGLRWNTFNVEIAAMMAPRPMLMVSATGDWTRNTPQEEFPAVRRIYRLFGKENEVENVHVDAGHNYNRQSREAVYRFLARKMLKDDDPRKYSEKDFRVEKDEDMLAVNGRSLPAGALTYDQLFSHWKAMSRRQADSIIDRRMMRERLMLAFGAEWPAKVWSETDGQRIALSRLGRGDRVPGLWHAGIGNPVLIVHPDGAAAARRLPAAERAIEAGRPLLAIDAFQTGEAVAPRDESHRHFLAFNLTADANRVQDILTALAFLRSQNRGRIELMGHDRAAAWCVFAAALAPLSLRVAADLGEFRGSDEDYIKNFFVPGIQRAGGLDAALALTRRYRRN